MTHMASLYSFADLDQCKQQHAESRRISCKHSCSEWLVGRKNGLVYHVFLLHSVHACAHSRFPPSACLLCCCVVCSCSCSCFCSVPCSVLLDLFSSPRDRHCLSMQAATTTYVEHLRDSACLQYRPRSQHQHHPHQHQHQ